MRAVRGLLFALVWLSCAWFGSWELNPNNATRMFAAIGLVEQGDAAIDRFQALTIDKAMFDGRYYMDKAPGMTLMALPAVAIADWATGERASDFGPLPAGPGFERYLRLRTRLAAATGAAVLTALAAMLLFDTALLLTGSAAAALFAALGFALGTPMWGWSTTVMGHAPVAALYVVALWAAVRGGEDGRRRYPAIVGLALGWAVVIEHQAVLAGVPIALWAVWMAWRAHGRTAVLRWSATLVAGGLVAGLPLVAYNLAAFGTPFRIGYAGVVGWEGMQQGLFGLGLPRPSRIATLLIGWKLGLVWVAPVLVLAPIGLFAWGETRGRRGLALACAAAAAIVLLVNAAYVYWQGGNTTGPRLSIPAVGPLALGLAAAWTVLPGRLARGGAAALLAVSIALNAAIAAAEIFAPPVTPFPVWDAVLAGRFAAGDLRTWPSEWLGPSEWFDWTPWHGFALWAAIALPTLAWLAWRVRLSPSGRS